MKLHLLFLLMDMLLLLACSYLWLKSVFVRVMHRGLELPIHKLMEVANGNTKEET